MTNLAFHNDPSLAEMVRARVDAHTAADEIVQGVYWENGKGCFIGCIVHGSNPTKVEGLTGFPVMLTRIAERIFEGLPNDQAKLFPQAMVAAPKIGADLSLVPWKFLHWLVGDVLQQHGTDVIRSACAPALDVLSKKAQGIPVSYAHAARAAAARAAHAARAAAAAAHAAHAAAADAAYAARAAAAAAHAAHAAAADAAYAAAAAHAAHAAAAAAAAAAVYARQAEKLIELLSNVK